LRLAVANTVFELAGERMQITISIGVTVLAPGCESRSALMAAADAALYRAKHAGRNRVCADA
jgi:diguanylate cyclase (GGDEF)-like protein